MLSIPWNAGGEELAVEAGLPRTILASFAVAGEVAWVDLDAAKGEGSNASLVRARCGLADVRAGVGIRDVATRAVLVRDLDESADVVDRLAPEHLELLVEDPGALAERVRCHGGLFVGAQSAEVFGDHGAGPNHVLPTGGGAPFPAEVAGRRIS